jgi:hypothetical protein
MRHRLYLLGLMVLTVAAAAVVGPSPWIGDPAEAMARTALRITAAGLLVLLWAFWVRAERRPSCR